jgi:hypothetical protein
MDLAGIECRRGLDKISAKITSCTVLGAKEGNTSVAKSIKNFAPAHSIGGSVIAAAPNKAI